MVCFFVFLLASTSCADSVDNKTDDKKSAESGESKPDEKRQKIALPSDLEADVLIELVSAKHYLTPSEDEVEKHFQTLTDFEDYLHTLDPYSKYVSPKKVKYIMARKTLPRDGIGIDIIENDDELLVLPIKDGALYRAGLTSPHYLKTINGKLLQFNDFNSYRFLSTMKKGDKYSVELEKNEFSTSDKYKVKVELTRRSLNYTRKKGSTRLLGIREFDRDTVPYIKKFFKKNRKFKHLVLDLRHSIGGSPHFTVDALSYFIGKGKNVVTYRSGAEKDKQGKTFDVPYSLSTSTKVTLLVSEFTASSAELFAHALKHYRPDITIIGKPSAGKCLAQKPFLLENGGALVLSVYELITPDNKSCKGKSLAVDTIIGNIELMPVDHVLKEVLAMNKE